MAYDARGIANYLLDYADSKRQSVTTMSLLKILYFAHAWHLAKTASRWSAAVRSMAVRPVCGWSMTSSRFRQSAGRRSGDGAQRLDGML